MISLTLSSFQFLIFLSVSAVIYYIIPKRFQNAFLLLASFVFYLFGTPEYALLLAATVAVNYCAGGVISRQQNLKKRRVILSLFIVLNILVLFLLKYINFFLGTLSPLLNLAGVRFELAVWAAPLGISYYTLMTVDYLVSVYKGAVEREKGIAGFVNYALYISFFPQMLAGPINRAKDMLSQFARPRAFSYGGTVEGMQRFLIGALKKVVLADGIAVITTRVFEDMSREEGGYTGLLLLAVQFFYVIRMFADFSGYSDMAVGAAKILGLNIMENFNAPYSAVSVNEFWRRWHISLSSWLRDYIYIPLGGNRKGRFRRYFNSMAVYFVCGLWHAPSWNYAVWGLCQSVMVIFEDMTFLREKNRRKADNPRGIVKFARWLYTMVFFYITLLFVSTKSITDVWYFLRNCFKFEPFAEFFAKLRHLSDNNISADASYLAIYWGGMLVAAVLIFLFDRRTYRSGLGGTADCNPLASETKTRRWAVYFAAGLMILFFYMIAGATPAPPIYRNM